MASVSCKITISAIQSLAPGDEIRDPQLKGFGVRRQKDAISYFVHTRIHGRLKRLTIGRHGSPWTPETARREAARLITAIRGGEDPARQRDERRELGKTFGEIAEEFLQTHGMRLKPSTREVYTIIVRVHLLPRFATKNISDISAADVARAHTAWRNKPRTANHAVAVLSKILSWATDLGYRTGDNPCNKIKRYAEVKRERYLTDQELSQLGAVLSEAESGGENPWVIGVIRMLILTGARLSEMLTLRWEYLDAERRTLRLPDSKTGAKTIHLNPEALGVLSSLPRIEGSPWVFPGHINGRHLVNLQKPWRELRRRAGLIDVRLHDLRHSFASIAIDVGGTLPVIGHLLGHTQAQTTARYAHVAPSPARRIADAAGARIAAAWQTAPLPDIPPSNDD